MSMNFEAARMQMLDQQIRAWEVLDTRVLDVLRDTPREEFVPRHYRELAFADIEIPLGHGQSMMTPKVEGRLLQALQVESADDILEIGTGSGFLTACLAKLGARVASIDIFPQFVESAGSTLRSQKIKNVEIDADDALNLAYAEQFDAIAVTASSPVLLEGFIDMLRPDGRMFIVVGRDPVMDAQLITKAATGDWTVDSLFETLLTPLINVDAAEPFVL
jgi:protein-L-isoaspartate(D-aspartate) O-methyltransferase